LQKYGISDKLALRNIGLEALHEREYRRFRERADHPAGVHAETPRDQGGSVLVVEDRKGELVLRPAAVVELDAYTDEEVARWDRKTGLRRVSGPGS